MLIANAIISAILQVLVFTAIPFLVYLIACRRAKGFFDYIGLHRPKSRTLLYATLLAIAFILPVLIIVSFSQAIREVVTAPNTVIGRLRLLGFSGTAVTLVALKALVQTSLSEEILFRGFIAKRLITWLGFTWGNLLQALFFGLIHLLLFPWATVLIAHCNRCCLVYGVGGLDLRISQRKSRQRLNTAELVDARSYQRFYLLRARFLALDKGLRTCTLTSVVRLCRRSFTDTIQGRTQFVNA